MQSTNLESLLLWRRFISTMSYFALQSVFFVYLQQKGLSNAQITFSLSVLFFCSQAMAIVAGVLGDRFGLAKIMLLGCFLDVLAYFLLLNADHYAVLLLATACFGLGNCFFGTNARACLLALAGEEYALKTRLQGKYLKVTSLSSMCAPLLAIPFIRFEQLNALIWLCFILEIGLFALMVKPFSMLNAVNQTVRFHWAQVLEIINKPFVALHLLLFIPLSIASSFFVIFPYLFDNKLHLPELVPVALFGNGLLTVLLQGPFSKHINLRVRQLIWISPLLALGMIVPWFITLTFPSIYSGMLYLVIFTVLEVYALTAIANLLVRFDNGKNRGFIFGASKLLQSSLTMLVMNLIPIYFLV